MRITPLLLLVAGLALMSPAGAQSLSERLGQLFGQSDTTENGNAPLAEADAAAGIKEALAQGTRNAVLRLGKKDGFLADQAVRIATPKSLRKAAKLARDRKSTRLNSSH